MPRLPVSLTGILCIVFLIAPAVCAQNALTFRIDSYIPDHFTDFEWRLDGGMKIGGTTTTNETYTLNGSEIEEYSAPSNDQSLNTGTYVAYRYETLARSITATMNLDGRFMNQNRQSSRYDISNFELDRVESSDRDTRSGEFSWSPSVSGRQYVRGDLFAELTASGLFDYSETSPQDDDITQSWYQYYGDTLTIIMQMHSRRSQPRDGKRYRVDVALRPGWGRITEGRFAAISLYIIDELADRGLITRQPTDAEMWRLTDLIYREITTHAVDDRLKKIDALLHVMEFLEDNGIASDAGPHGYVLIQDIWDYFPHHHRPFGVLCSAGFGYEYDYNSSQATRAETRRYDRIEYDSDPAVPVDTTIGEPSTHDTYSHDTFSRKSPYAVIGAAWHKPVNMRWQINADVEGKYYVNAVSSDEDWRVTYTDHGIAADRISTQRTEYDANYVVQSKTEARYIFDSRTSASLTAAYRLTHYNSTETGALIDNRLNMTRWEGPSRRDFKESRVNLTGRLTYRISIPTTLEANIYYNYSDRDTFVGYDASYASGSYGLSANISHYLF